MFKIFSKIIQKKIFKNMKMNYNRKKSSKIIKNKPIIF